MKEKIAFTILRAGLGIVFLIFGMGKFQNDIWAQTIRNMDFFAKLPWSVNISLTLIGITEVVTGISLIAGLFSRIFAFLAALELTGILVLINFQEARDLGLLGVAVYLSLVKREAFGICNFFKKK
jgi:uncharacterized membrane protein YphA (DoxX/SURF4 family)